MLSSGKAFILLSPNRGKLPTNKSVYATGFYFRVVRGKPKGIPLSFFFVLVLGVLFDTCPCAAYRKLDFPARSPKRFQVASWCLPSELFKRKQANMLRGSQSSWLP